MLNDGFDDQLRETARNYNAPPETPREEMWERIVAARAEKTERTRTGVTPLRPPRRLRHLTWPAGIAALLAIGVALGRITAPEPQTPAPAKVAAVATPQVNDVAYRIAATEHLSQSEAFLTLFRTSVRQGGSEQLASGTARQLLATNRLLLDSPAASDDRTRLLLQDLELVLAGV